MVELSYWGHAVQDAETLQRSCQHWKRCTGGCYVSGLCVCVWLERERERGRLEEGRIAMEERGVCISLS